MDSMGTYLAHGASGLVEQYEETAIKRPWPDNDASLQELKIEARIYQHLGPHPRVLRFLSWDDEQSILRTEYMKNGNLKLFIASNQCSSEFLHSRNVIYSDIKPDNFLLDEQFDLKVCDFAGSSLHGAQALVCGSTRFCRPVPFDSPRDAKDDILALGPTIYTILTGEEPFGDMETIDVEARFSSAEFPDTSNLPFDEVMQSCWGGRADIQQVCRSIESSMRQMQKPEQPWDFSKMILTPISHLYATLLESVGYMTRSQT
ncbi:hypothetical protein E4T48_05612 [Aureobasidium sp. EXF-10727]|nr:hypothetical protein E4T48_05612 [Aureobasidium sp. EXF-10727]